jgi:hypothetical protein
MFIIFYFDKLSTMIINKIYLKKQHSESQKIFILIDWS